MTTATEIAKHVLEPLNDATAQLLSPVPLMPNDRLEIGMGQTANEFIMQAVATAAGQRGPASRAATLDWFARTQEREELGYGRWKVAATDFNVMVTNAVWPQDRITFTDETARTTYNYLLLRFMEQTMCAQRTAVFKETGQLPDPPAGWVEHPEFPLAAYQRCAAWNAIESEGYALFMEQGTGKTPTAIAVMCHLAREKYTRTGKPYYCIVVCPKNVKANWAREIQKFCTVPGRVVVLRGGKLHRVKQLIEIAEDEPGSMFNVVITSYETLQKSWDALQMFNWDLGIADEAHMFKSPWAKRANAMVKLREKCERRLALTGTPVTNSLLDLYFPLEWLGEGMSGFVEWKEFRSFYNKYSENGEDNYQGAKVLVGFQNLPMLHERLARVSFSITKKEAMPSLPEKTYLLEECGMSPKQKEVYRKVSSELAAEIQDALDDSPSAITINNTLTKLLRLSQITAGYVVVDAEYDDDGNPIKSGADRIKWFDEVPKLDAIVEGLKARGPDDKTIVWCCWVPVIKKISERLTAEGIPHVLYYGGMSEADRAEAERCFNLDPKYKVFLGNPAAGGVGLNLPGYDASNPDAYTTNASEAWYYACNWSGVQRWQSEDRNHGRGRCRQSIQYRDFIVPGTIDVEILSKLQSKKQVAMEAGDVREILKRLVSFDPSAMED
jgi:SNF2 family DNA or RNA helicase